MKKFISYLLTFILLFSNIPMDAFAEADLSYRLLLESDEEIRQEDKVVGQIDHVYLLEFDNEEDREEAVSAYDGFLLQKEDSNNEFGIRDYGEISTHLIKGESVSDTYADMVSLVNSSPKKVGIEGSLNDPFLQKGVECLLENDIQVFAVEEEGFTLDGVTWVSDSEEIWKNLNESPKPAKKQLKSAPLRAPAVGTNYTVTFEGMEGFFNDPGNTSNDVTYEWGPLPNNYYSHTFNISDDGVQHGNYNNSMNVNDVVTVPDASKLHVVITYGGESVSYDWVCMWAGNHPNYTASNNYSSSVTGKLGGGSHTAAANTKEYTINGNSATFAFRSDGSGVGDGYGYYAVITPLDADGNPISRGDGNNIVDGTYIVPRYPGKTLDAWYRDAERTDRVDDLEHEEFTGDTTLYAGYKDDDWYRDYNYTLDPATGTITVTKYNGNASDVVLPSKAIINGVEYSTMVSGSVYASKTSINTVTFDEGVKSGTSLYALFSGCSNLQSVNLRDFDTSACTNMSNMFANCSSMTSADVSMLDTGQVTNMSNMFSGCSKLTSLDLHTFNTSAVTNMGGMFNGCSAMTSLNTTGWDTSNVTSMASMFYNNSAMTSFDLSHFNTSSVTNMASMFYNCNKLTSLDLSAWNTENVTNMASMFSNCTKLNSLNTSTWDTGQVTDMQSMFNNCYGMKSLDLSHFDTQNVTRMNSMFYNCNGLTSLDVSGFDTGKVTDMSSMFYSCSGLKNLNVSNFDTKNVTNMSNMFRGCSQLKTLDLSNFDTGKVTNMTYMFYGDSGLEYLDTSSFDTKNVTNMSYMFYNCSKLDSLDVTGFDTGKVTNMAYMFYGCSKLPELDVSSFNTSKVTNMNGMFYNCSGLKELDVTNFNTANVTNMAHMFRSCSGLTELDLSNFNTAKVTDMQYMFASCSKLPELDLSSFNTAKVTNMPYMFYGCSKLSELDLSNFNTANVTNMSYMFHSCTSLEDLNVSSFNTGKVTNMAYMFYNCAKLPEVDVSSFNTANVTNMSCMFSTCQALENLDVTNFNTGKVTNMTSMFASCNNLTELDVSGFNTANVTALSSMFSNCSKLEELDVSNFNTAKVTDMSYMFNNCNALNNLDVSGFNTANVTSFTQMFQNCSSLEELDVTNFNTAKGTSFAYMFAGTNNLPEIDISTWNMTKVTNTNYMFNSPGLAKMVLGPQNKFAGTNTFYNCNWWKGEDMTTKYSANELRNIYNASMADTYYKEYIVNFNGQGGKVSTKTYYTIFDEEIEELPTATKLGYTFNGWYDARVDGNEIHVGDHYRQDTYYAHWTPNNYTLRLNPNGGLGDVKNIPMTYESTYQLQSYLFEKPGYEIVSWNTKRDGSGDTYAVDDLLTMLTPDDGGLVTLYAQWSNDWSNIHFDSQGGELVPDKHIVRGRPIGSLFEPAREGYQFMGWYTEPLGQGTKISANTISAGDVTYYAYWRPDPTITFISEGNTVYEKTVPYNAQLNTLPEVTRHNYVFDGWYTEPDGQGSPVTKTMVCTEDFNAYAKWVLRPVFDPDGGIITTQEDRSDYDDKDPEHFTLTSFPVASKPGYTFDGWYTENGTKLELGDEIDLTRSSHIIAHWTPIETITISFNANGATNPKDVHLYKGQAIAALPYPSKSGYKFLGWETADHQPVDEQTVFTEDTTLHAKWSKLIPISFDPNGGATVADRKVESGSSLNTIPGCRRAGYILEGWYDVDTNEKLTEDTIFTTPKTYRANWIPENNTAYDDTLTYIYSASWSNASNQNVDNIDDNLEFHPSDTSTQTAQLHIRFELNKGVDSTLPVGSVHIRIPKSVWRNWDGDLTGTNNLSTNLPKWPNTRAGMYFSYLEEEDDYILINNVDLPGGAGVDLTVNYTVNPLDVPGGAMDYNNDYIDGYDYYEHTFPIEFTIDKNMDGAIDVTETRDLSIEMHTRVRTTQTKGFSSVSYSWNDSWGPRPDDADDYFYAIWNLNENFLSTTNQPKEYYWSEDTVHDGTVVKMPGRNSSGTVITKHPKSLLADLNEYGVELYNEAVVHEEWKSGYETTHRVSASTILRGRSYPTGEFDKHDASNYLINGGQETLVDDLGEVNMPYELIYDGSSYNLDTMPQPTPDGGYEKNPRTIIFTDGLNGDFMYSSGAPREKYIWVPETGNVILNDSDYYIKNIRFSLTEYDAKYLSGTWSNRIQNTDTTQYEDIEIWVRLANQNEFIKYRNVKGNDTSTIPLPERTVGFQIRHSSSYYDTRLSANATFVVKPTQKILSLVQNDMSEKTTSIFKNKAVCTIEDSQGEVFFQATNRSGDHDSAHKELYELNISSTSMKVYKDSANSSAVLLDVDRGTQDNPMIIYANNYNNSGRKKLLNNGVFYDLLPMGTTVDEDSIVGVYGTGNSNSLPFPVSSYSSYRNGNSSSKLDRNFYSVEFVPNWEGSGQTMMIITTNIPKSYKPTGIGFYYLLHNTFENIVQSGTTLENDVAFANTAEGHVIPDSITNARSILQNADYYQNLEWQHAGDIGFAKASTHYNPIDAFSWGFFKTVKADTEFVPEAEVIRNSTYTYRLNYSQSAYAKSDRLVFYDVLEGGTDTKTSQWIGQLAGVDTKTASEKQSYGKTVTCKPVVYYSTKPRNEFTGADFDITKSEIWTNVEPADLSTVTAIAIDCTKNTDGTDFTMVGKESLSVYVNMKAPPDAENIGLTATNEAVSMARKYTNNVPDDEQTAEHSDTTITIKDMNPELHKTSNPASGTLAEPTIIDLGEEVEYTISVKNTDPSSIMYDVVVEDMIPEHMQVNNSDITVYLQNKANALTASQSPRVDFVREGRKLTFTIHELLPGEQMHFGITGSSDANHTVYSNQAVIPRINEVEKEIESETTYHETNFWNIHIGKKIFGTNDFLPGATLKLSSSGGTPIETWLTENTLHTVKLLPGDYVLEEMNPPTGYNKAANITFTISHDGLVTSNPAAALLGTDTLTMFDVPRKSLSIHKESSGNYVDTDDTFDFRIELGGLEALRNYPVSGGEALDGNPVPVNISGTETTKTFVVTLKHGQTFSINDLPENATYKVTEVRNSYTPSYTIDAGTGSTVLQPTGANALSGLDLSTETETLEAVDHDTTIAFSNVRNIKHGSIPLSVKKRLHGQTLNADQFTFQLLDSQDNVIDTKRNDGSGNVTFDHLHYTTSDIAREYIYRIVETDKTDPAIKYDNTIAYVKVEVLDTPTLDLDVRATYYDGPPSGTGSSSFTFHNYKYVSATLHKKDQRNAALSGALLQIRDENNNIVDEWTDADHVVKLWTGSFTFHEERAPLGYEKAADIPIVVNEEGVMFIGGEEKNEVTMTDPDKMGSVKIHKTDYKDDDLEGVTFALKDLSGNILETKVTDNKGELVFANLRPGKYIIIEQQTVDGNTLLADPIPVTLPMAVPRDEAVGVDTSQASLDGDTYYFYDLTYNVQNFTNLDLPQTGGVPLACIALLGSFFVLLGFLFRRKRT